ncbi:MAG: tryptophan--tRNA ligase [Proteobacteria bacterium]|nr:tryptophan--tRNA ligase [Pseudomonadota bacterium]
MKTVLSGMRPTGKLHFGHLHGVLKNWLKLQQEYKCFFFAADWHALTSEYEDTSNIKKDTIEMFIDWLSVGIDPEKATVFIQSAIKEHAELHLIFSMITPLSWLERNPTYKEQLQEINNKDLSTYGFLGYPVLQSADILIYKASYVPVGIDQVPHVELTREIARRFNFIFKTKLFPEPEPLLTDTPKLLGVDGRKMSKSYNNAIYLSDKPEVVEKKILTMMTDPHRVKKTDPGDPDLCPLFLFHKIYTDDEERAEIIKSCKEALFGCIDCKKRLLAKMRDEINAYWEKRQYYENNTDRLLKIIEEGNEKAREFAVKTMEEVREIIGL